LHDVIIVGGGPAGLTVATELAARGHDVRVLEEHASIGVPVHCTGVLGLDAIAEFDLPQSAILDVRQAARFRAPDGSFVRVDSDRVHAAILDRGEFDASLADRARGAGAALEAGQRVVSLDVTERTVTATTATGRRVSGRAGVLACGASYRLNRRLGLGIPRRFVQSAQAEVSLQRAEDMIEVGFSRRTAPGGFTWLVPFRRNGCSRARVGLLCERQAAAGFGRWLETLQAEGRTDGSRLLSPRLRILPLAPVERTYRNRLLAVGDAAGLTKPTTGGGIYYGLLSGRIAAGVLDRALVEDRLDERRLAGYEGAWRQRLGPEIRAGLAFRAVASRLDDRSVNALIALARVDGLVPLIKQTADFNWHRGAALALLRHQAFRQAVLSSLLG
jgi:digeranylgeranylglycerophospholipid reductase